MQAQAFNDFHVDDSQHRGKYLLGVLDRLEEPLPLIYFSDCCAPVISPALIARCAKALQRAGLDTVTAMAGISVQRDAA